MDRHPYIFRSDPTNPPSLYSMSAVKVLARYNTKELLVTKQKFQKLDSKASFERAKRQLTRYFGLLNDLIKSDLLEMLFNYKWDSYRQKHRSILDKEQCCNEKKSVATNILIRQMLNVIVTPMFLTLISPLGIRAKTKQRTYNGRHNGCCLDY